MAGYGKAVYNNRYLTWLLHILGIDIGPEEHGWYRCIPNQIFRDLRHYGYGVRLYYYGPASVLDIDRDFVDCLFDEFFLHLNLGNNHGFADQVDKFGREIEMDRQGD